jgi:phenylpropionate dioxygenase-like ring-hydroxylating dioxygenase large terminal subunit
MSSPMVAPRAVTQDQLVEDLRHAIDQGLTLPPYWYTDPDVLAFEQQSVFNRSWQYAGHMDRLAEPGDFILASIGRVPVIIVMDQDRSVRAFLNLCRHRGHEVVLPCAEQPARRRKTLQCPYHGWTFNLDGSLRSAPRSNREASFDKSALGLVPVSLDTWGPLIFINLDPSPVPFAEYLGGMPEVAGSRGLHFDHFTEHKRYEYEFATNWKIAVDNNFECYHCATAHPGFAKLFKVDPDAYEIKTFDYTATQLSPNKQLPDSDAREWGDFRFYYVWPATFIVDHTITYNVMSLVPTEPGRTKMLYEIYRRDDVEEQAVDEYAAFYTSVFAEDAGLIESVQRGQASGVFPPGPLLLDSEHLLRYLQIRLLDSLES